MPKVGMEPIRKAALVKATITEIGRAGSLDVTVSQIAKRAGMSSALAHHYFGSKEEIFLAAMRHILSLYGAEVRGALRLEAGAVGGVELRYGSRQDTFRASLDAGQQRIDGESDPIWHATLGWASPRGSRIDWQIGLEASNATSLFSTGNGAYRYTSLVARINIPL